MAFVPLVCVCFFLSFILFLVVLVLEDLNNQLCTYMHAPKERAFLFFLHVNLQTGRHISHIYAFWRWSPNTYREVVDRVSFELTWFFFYIFYKTLLNSQCMIYITVGFLLFQMKDFCDFRLRTISSEITYCLHEFYADSILCLNKGIVRGEVSTFF